MLTISAILANTILSSGQSRQQVTISTVLVNSGSCFFSALWVLFAPIKLFWNLHCVISLRLAVIDSITIGKADLKEFLCVGNIPILEELISGLLESVALSIVYEHGALINNRHV